GGVGEFLLGVIFGLVSINLLIKSNFFCFSSIGVSCSKTSFVFKNSSSARSIGCAEVNFSHSVNENLSFSEKSNGVPTSNFSSSCCASSSTLGSSFLRLASDFELDIWSIL